jgi:1-acyl-sn-glycerol-3-phosphate acyltransferase
VARGRMGFWQWVAIATVKPTMILWTRRNWSGMENIPATGGVILAANHLSEFDPLVIAHYVYDAGRWPQFLAKAEIFKNRIFGWILRAARQIPVYRGTADAVKSLSDAITAVKGGGSVVIYPEGTTPKDGDLWPQRGKTGIARLYLETKAPVVPIVSWGPQEVFDPRGGGKLHYGRKSVTVVAGPPVDLSKWDGAAPSGTALYAITDEIMTALRDMLAKVRNETAPPQPSSSRNGNGGAG